MAILDHRTTRPLLATAAAGALCLGLGACGGGGSTSVSGAAGTSSSAAPSTAASTTPDPTTSSPSTSTTSESGSPAAADLKVGQCYDNTEDWSLIPCTQSHQLEISAIVDTTKDADDILKRGILRTWTCNNVVAGYVGSPTAAFSLVLGQPVPAAVDTGSSTHIACAIAEAKADDSGYQELTHSLKNIVKDKGYLPFRICTSDRPSRTDSPKIVPCTKPHKAETVGGYVVGKADGKYPGDKAVTKAALAKCEPLAKRYLGTVRSDVIAAVNSTGKAGWERGTTMTACFVEATTGTFVKPLKGMKDKPLSAFQ